MDFFESTPAPPTTAVVVVAAFGDDDDTDIGLFRGVDVVTVAAFLEADAVDERSLVIDVVVVVVVFLVVVVPDDDDADTTFPFFTLL